MTETRAVINVDINTAGAAAELRRLQSQLNAFQSSLSSSNRVQAQAAKNLSLQLRELVNNTGMFSSETVRMRTSAGRLDDALSRGKGSIAQYFNSFKKGSTEAAQVMSLAHARASALQTQFVATGAAAGGYREALAIRPLSAFNNATAVSAEKLAIQRAMLTQASTQMINFGKNTQWAGRQLMVGFTVPLTIFGMIAGKTYMELEKQAIAFKKVYGDSFTTPQELQENLDAVKALSSEYTKFGIAASKTMELAAQAAAMGAQGETLKSAVTESTKLATLGQMEQTKALETTIALQNAFGLSGEKLAKSVNFLNMVENQTVLTLQDLADAIPRVSPVIKGLGGTVEDMAAMLAAMKEGGVSAAQGANALKSGLASLINPTNAAVESLAKMGIGLKSIIESNRGDLLGTVQDFARALETLDDFSRQQALEKVFGKYQYARLGALFNNIVKDGTQASKVLKMTALSAEELQAVANKELKVISDSPATRMTASMEKMKLAIAPIGEMFINFAIPVIELFTRLLNIFNNLPEGVKKLGAIGAIIVGVIIPAGTMFLGLFLNLIGTLVKFGHIVGVAFKGFLTGGISGAITTVSQSLRYMSLSEIDAATAARQLGTSTSIVNTALRGQIAASDGANVAIIRLTAAYAALNAQMAIAAAMAPRAFPLSEAGRQAAGEPPAPGSPRRFRFRRNAGGSIPYLSDGDTVPGSGNTDTVPAMLTPGEFVINKKATEKNLPLLHAINDGNTPLGFNKGGRIPGVQYAAVGGGILKAIGKLFGPKPKTPKTSSAYDTPPTAEETQRVLANWPDRPIMPTMPAANQSQAVASANKSKGIYEQLVEKNVSGSNNKTDTLRFMVEKLGFSPAALGLRAHGNFVLGFSKSTNLAMAGKNPTLTKEKLLAELVDSNGQIRRGIYSPLEQQMSSYFKNGQMFDHGLFDKFFRAQVALSKEPISNQRFEKISRNSLRQYLKAKDYSGPDSKSFIRDILSKDTVRANASRSDITSALAARGIPYETNGKDIIATVNGVRYNLGSVAGREMGSLGRPQGIKPYGDLEMSPGLERLHANKGGMIPGVQYRQRGGGLVKMVEAMLTGRYTAAHASLSKRLTTREAMAVLRPAEKAGYNARTDTVRSLDGQMLMIDDVFNQAMKSTGQGITSPSQFADHIRNSDVTKLFKKIPGIPKTAKTSLKNNLAYELNRLNPGFKDDEFAKAYASAIKTTRAGITDKKKLKSFNEAIDKSKEAAQTRMYWGLDQGVPTYKTVEAALNAARKARMLTAIKNGEEQFHFMLRAKETQLVYNEKTGRYVGISTGTTRTIANKQLGGVVNQDRPFYGKYDQLTKALYSKWVGAQSSEIAAIKTGVGSDPAMAMAYGKGFRRSKEAMDLERSLFIRNNDLPKIGDEIELGNLSSFAAGGKDTVKFLHNSDLQKNAEFKGNQLLGQAQKKLWEAAKRRRRILAGKIIPADRSYNMPYMKPGDVPGPRQGVQGLLDDLDWQIKTNRASVKEYKAVVRDYKDHAPVIYKMHTPKGTPMANIDDIVSAENQTLWSGAGKSMAQVSEGERILHQAKASVMGISTRKLSNGREATVIELRLNPSSAQYPQFRADGGQIFESGPSKKIVPGVGNTDTVPAMLTPGEFVINKKATSENISLLHSINNGSIQAYAKGGVANGIQYLFDGAQVAQAGTAIDPNAPSFKGTHFGYADGRPVHFGGRGGTQRLFFSDTEGGINGFKEEVPRNTSVNRTTAINAPHAGAATPPPANAPPTARNSKLKSFGKMGLGVGLGVAGMFAGGAIGEKLGGETGGMIGSIAGSFIGGVPLVKLVPLAKAGLTALGTLALPVTLIVAAIAAATASLYLIGKSNQEEYARGMELGKAMSTSTEEIALLGKTALERSTDIENFLDQDESSAISEEYAKKIGEAKTENAKRVLRIERDLAIKSSGLKNSRKENTEKFFDERIANQKATGEGGRNQLENLYRQRNLALNVSKVSKADFSTDTTYGSQFIKGDIGKGVVSNIKQAGDPQFQSQATVAAMGAISDAAYGMGLAANEFASRDTGQKLAQYVLSGVMTQDQASSVARAIGVELKDARIGASIAQELTGLIGVEGYNAKNAPGQLANNIAEVNQKKTDAALGLMNKNANAVFHQNNPGGGARGGEKIGAANVFDQKDFEKGTGNLSSRWLASFFMGQADEYRRNVGMFLEMSANNVGSLIENIAAVGLNYDDLIAKAKTTTEIDALRLEKSVQISSLQNKLDEARKSQLTAIYGTDIEGGKERARENYESTQSLPRMFQDFANQAKDEQNKPQPEPTSFWENLDNIANTITKAGVSAGASILESFSIFGTKIAGFIESKAPTSQGTIISDQAAAALDKKYEGSIESVYLEMVRGAINDNAASAMAEFNVNLLSDPAFEGVLSGLATALSTAEGAVLNQDMTLEEGTDLKQRITGVITNLELSPEAQIAYGTLLAGLNAKNLDYLTAYFEEAMAQGAEYGTQVTERLAPLLTKATGMLNANPGLAEEITSKKELLTDDKMMKQAMTGINELSKFSQEQREILLSGKQLTLENIIGFGKDKMDFNKSSIKKQIQQTHKELVKAKKAVKFALDKIKLSPFADDKGLTDPLNNLKNMIKDLDEIKDPDIKARVSAEIDSSLIIALKMLEELKLMTPGSPEYGVQLQSLSDFTANMQTSINTAAVEDKTITDNDGGGGGQKEDPLGDLFRKLRDQIDVQAKVGTTIEATGEKTKSIFDRLRGKGLNESIIKYFKDMDPKTALKVGQEVLKNKAKMNTLLSLISQNASTAQTEATASAKNDAKFAKKFMNSKIINQMRAFDVSSLAEDPEALAGMQEVIAGSRNPNRAGRKYLKAYTEQQEQIKQTNLKFAPAKILSEVSQNNSNLKARGMLQGKGFTQEESSSLMANEQMAALVTDSIKQGKALTQETLDLSRQYINSLKGPAENLSDALDKISNQYTELNNQLSLSSEIIEEYNIKPMQDDLDKFSKENAKNQEKSRRLSEALSKIQEKESKEKEAQAEKEKAINDEFNSRIEALDKIEKLNTEIANKQKDQLDLASALSRGDIAGAAKAQLTMQQNLAKARQDELKEALKEAQKNAIETSKEESESKIKGFQENVNGVMLDRTNIQKQIDDIDQKLYDNSLEQYDIEMKMTAEKEKQAKIALVSSKITRGQNVLNSIKELSSLDKGERAAELRTIQSQAKLVGGEPGEGLFNFIEENFVALQEATSDGIATTLAPGITSFLNAFNLQLANYATETLAYTAPDLNPMDDVDGEKKKFELPGLEDITAALGASSASIGSYLTTLKDKNEKFNDSVVKNNPWDILLTGAQKFRTQVEGAFAEFSKNLTTGAGKAIDDIKEKAGKLWNKTDVDAEKIGPTVDQVASTAGQAAPGMHGAGGASVPQPAKPVSVPPPAQTKQPTGPNFGGRGAPGQNPAQNVKKPKRNNFGGIISSLGSTEPPPRMMNYGGMMKKYAYGSMVPGVGMTDKVPALLTPGEFVIRKSVVESYGPMLSNLNSQVFPKMNMTSAMPSTQGNENEGTVYNYQVSVALNGSNLDPNDVANVVMQKIKMSESRNIRGTRVG